MPDIVGRTDQNQWDLSDRTDRIGLYSNLMVEGTQHMLMGWLDGALLCDVWTELTIPSKVRCRWAPVVEAASRGRSADVFYG